MAWETVVPAVLSVAGTAAKAGGQIKGGQAASQADYFKAQVANNNAAQYDQAAERTIEGGMIASDTVGLKGAQTVGKIKVQQAANNVDVNTGSAVDVRAAAAKAGKLDQDTVLSNSQLQGYGYRVKAQQERSQAAIHAAEAEDKKRGAAAGAAGSLIGGASSLPFGWLKDIGSGGSSGAPTVGAVGNEGGSFGGFSGTGDY